MLWTERPAKTLQRHRHHHLLSTSLLLPFFPLSLKWGRHYHWSTANPVSLWPDHHFSCRSSLSSPEVTQVPFFFFFQEKRGSKSRRKFLFVSTQDACHTHRCWDRKSGHESLSWRRRERERRYYGTKWRGTRPSSLQYQFREWYLWGKKTEYNSQKKRDRLRLKLFISCTSLDSCTVSRTWIKQISVCFKTHFPCS